jgi:DNA-binding CsgD family transcriptional regulator
MSREQGDYPGVPELTRAELRLLPLLTTSLSIDEIAQALELPRDAVLDLTESIYAKLGPLGERRLHSV